MIKGDSLDVNTDCGMRPLEAVDLHRRELSLRMVTYLHNSLKLYLCRVVRDSLSYR